MKTLPTHGNPRLKKLKNRIAGENMPICTTCQQIDLRKMLLDVTKREGVDDSPNGIFLPKIPVYQHSVSWADFKKECELCRILWLKYALKRLVRFKKLTGHSTFDLRVKRTSQSWQGDSITRLHISTAGNLSEQFAQEYDLEFLVSDESAAKPQDYLQVQTFLLRELSPWSGSQHCLSLAAYWQRRCLMDHPLCTQYRGLQKPLPTRVINVGDDNTSPSLFISNGISDSWLALSYCWGTSTNLMLNQSTHEDLKRGLPLEVFPKTIRDAIIITRALNEKYLWVDALCIMQDSPDDWQEESGKMAEVYTNASLTIIAAAESSLSATSGIFHRRTLDVSAKLPWLTTNIEGKGVNDQSVIENLKLNEDSRQLKPQFADIEICVRASKRPAGQLLLESGPNLKCSPWANRGWTLQEELLSLRTLIFGPSQILWSCQSTFRCEDGKTLRDEKNEDLPDISECMLDHTDCSPNVLYKKWSRIVTVYSSRKLTYNSDKMVAIASVAKILNKHLKDEYCVGLWRRDLFAGLCWRLWEPGHKPRPIPTPTYSEEYPSWSWIGVNGGVRYDTEPNSRFATPKPLFSIEDVQITYSSKNSYGQIERAELKISGPCYPFQFKDRNRAPPSKFLGYIERLLDDDEEFKSRRRVESYSDLLILQIANASYAMDQHHLHNPWFSCNTVPDEYYLLILEPLPLQPLNGYFYPRFRRVSFLHLELGGILRADFLPKPEEYVEIAKEINTELWPIETIILS